MLREFFLENLDMVFFIYGLAFYVMGVAILIQPRKEESDFKLAGFIWLLGMFGIIHGMNEWLDMYIIIKGYELKIWHAIRVLILTVSFALFFEFGRKLIFLSCDKRFSGWVTVFLCAVTVFFIFMSGQDHTIWPRYFLGFPGGLMSSSGFYLYYKKNKNYLEKFNVSEYFLWASGATGFYGILTGFIVPKGGFFPASVINDAFFLNAFKIPVQIFRAACAVILSRAVWNILHIFNCEIINNLKDSIEKLKRAEDLATMGKFAGMIGHEFRNQLNVMKSSLYFLKLKFPEGDEKTKRHLEILENQVAETENIIEDILMFAKGRQINPQDIDLKYLIFDCVNLARAPAKIKIITELGNNLPIIKGDEIKLRRSFMNIILNALQSMEAGGRLLISADRSDKFIEILFKDTGCGISKENMERIFDPFFTTKKDGTGLGLATCRTIIDAHNGAIDIKSEIDKGTTVKIKIPINQS